MSGSAILTNNGLLKIASASPLDQLTITQIAIGDGVNPLDPNSTALVNEVYRDAASTPIRSTTYPNTLVFELNIPPTTGGFTCREIGAFDADGDLIAVGTLDELVKPTDGINYVARINVKLANAAQVDVFYDNQGAIDHSGLRNRDAVGAHDDIYTRNVTSAQAIAEDAPIGTRYTITDFGKPQYDVVEGSDTGGLYIEGLPSGRKLKLIPKNGIVNAKHVGAKDLIDFDFNPLFKYCVQNNLTVSFYGCQCLTSMPIDVSAESNRILKIVGDIEDKNNTGVYNLVSTTSGVAIKCKEVIHNRFGLAGTLSIVDTIPASNTGIEASESVTHIDSSLRNFNTHYKRTGGFYHTVEGGTLRRGRVLYDITGVPMYNAKFNATHSDFETGILATGGNGPAVLEGSWEKFTSSVFESTTTASVFGIHLNGAYIENYPDENIASGLTSVDGKYKAPSAFINGDGTITGFARISCNGITDNVFDLDQPKCIDVTIGLVDQGIGSLPTTIFSATGCRNYNIKTSVDDGDFSSVDFVSSGLANSLQSMGSYQDFDAKVKCPTITRTNELVNGWTASEGVEITANTGTVNLAARLNASSATSTTCFNLIEPRLRPERNLRFNGTSNDPSNPVVDVRVLTNGDILIINTDGSTPTASAVNFSFTYCI